MSEFGLGGIGQISVNVHNLDSAKVEDIQQAYEILSTRGVRFDGKPHLIAKMDSHDLWMAFFRDSENNLLSVMSEVARS